MSGITGFDRAKELHIQKIMIGRMMGKYRFGIQREIVRAMREAADIAGVGGAPMEIQATHEKNMQGILNNLWRESTDMMASRIYSSANVKHGRFDLVIKNNEQERPWMSAILTWIRERSGGKIQQITDTTVKQVQNILEKGIANGDSLEEIAKDIRKRAPIAGGSRSQTIARTEVHGAAMYGSFEGANSTGFEMTKEWIATYGGNTRETHAAVDGEQIEMNEYFYVGDSQMLHPGGDGEPEEVINCQCGITYNTV